MNNIKGYVLEFESKPFQTVIPNEISFNESEIQIIDQEVDDLLKKGAIVGSEWEPDQFISNIFVVKKPNGKFRPIINLKRLNNFVHYEHFKQEHFKIVLELIQENDFFCSVDLQDAYFSVPIHPDYQKYLKFTWKGVLYAFVCLPFGYSAAPRVFTKLLKPVYAWFRSQSIRCAYYIDDSINMSLDRHICLQNAETICSTLQSLGYVVNPTKSVLVPTQRIVFFGFIIDSVQFMIFLTEEKIEKIILKARRLLSSRRVLVRNLASFIGLLVNAFYAVLEAPLHYRQLERLKLEGLGNNNSFDNEIMLNGRVIQDLHWWIGNVNCKNGKRIRPKKVSFICQTDASLLGWSCVDNESGRFVNAEWTKKDSEYHINFLELKAIFLGLQSLYDKTNDCHIRVFSDNVSAVTYVNDMGGMTSQKMDGLAAEIWQWCLKNNNYLSAAYVKGSENNVADFYSRYFNKSSEWMLKQEIFERICSEYFIPDIDLFASSLNCKCNKFVSWVPEPQAYFNDAFSISWSDFEPYLFPPFALIGKVLNKLVQDNVKRAILIIPLWRS